MASPSSWRLASWILVAEKAAHAAALSNTSSKLMGSSGWPLGDSLGVVERTPIVGDDLHGGRRNDTGEMLQPFVRLRYDAARKHQDVLILNRLFRELMDEQPLTHGRGGQTVIQAEPRVEGGVGAGVSRLVVHASCDDHFD